MAVAAFFLIVLFGAKFAPNGKFFDDSFKASDTRALKGALAICVILHHLCTYLSEAFPSLLFFEQLGFIAVGGFFLISGYGLAYGVTHKENYLVGFFRKRFLAVLIPYYLIVPFYFVARFMTRSLTLRYAVETLLGITLWYVFAIAVMYISFYVSFRLFGVKWGRVAVTVLAALYALVLLVIYRLGKYNFGFWWYNSIICFPLGVWYCSLRDKLDPILKKRYFSILMFTVLAFIFSWKTAFGNYAEDARRLYVLAFQVACAALFSLAAVMLSMKLRIGNRLLTFCGDHSLELYLAHAPWIYFLQSGVTVLGHRIFVSSPDYYITGIIAATVITSVIVHKVAVWLHKKIK